MKMRYEKPEVEFELFQLDTSIASQCSVPVSFGPGDDNHTACADFPKEPGIEFPDGRVDLLDVGNGGFYEDTCVCYTGAESAYFTS